MLTSYIGWALPSTNAFLVRPSRLSVTATDPLRDIAFLYANLVDAGRHAIERIDPAAYLAAPYYERWLASVESLIVDAGVCSTEDIDARVEALRCAGG